MSAIGGFCVLLLDGESWVKEQAAHEDDAAVDEREAHREAHLQARRGWEVVGS